MPSSVPRMKMLGSNLLKSKQRPLARPMRLLSSSLFLAVSLSLMSSSGSSLFFMRFQFMTLPSLEME